MKRVYLTALALAAGFAVGFWGVSAYGMRPMTCCVTCAGATFCGCGVETACGSCCLGPCCGGGLAEALPTRETQFNIDLAINNKNRSTYVIRPSDELHLDYPDESGEPLTRIIRADWVDRHKRFIRVQFLEPKRIFFYSYLTTIRTIDLEDEWQAESLSQAISIDNLKVFGISSS